MLDEDDPNAALSIGGDLRGACLEAECVYVWSGTDVVIAVFVEFDDDTTPDAGAVDAATQEFVTTVALTVAESA